MKYLLLIGIALAVLWMVRQQGLGARARNPSRASPRAGRHRPATEIVECLRCTVHLPRAEAVIGQRGPYCCDAHRREAEGD